MTSIDDFAAGFLEEPGYLNFASVGPPGRAVLDEQRALTERLATARFGSFDALFGHDDADGLIAQDERMRRAVARLIGTRPDQVAAQPNTSSALMQIMFGLGGRVAMSSREYPSIPFAATRAADIRNLEAPAFFDPHYGRVTPGSVREQLDESCAAVAVSLVDFRTGYVADLDGIRQVIGDRLLIVDAIQGFGVVDAAWQAADVIASGGQKWVRAGWGTGFLAMSDRARERLEPVLSGANGTDVDLPLDGVLPPRSDARAFTMGYPGPIVPAMFATALEQIAEVGVPAIAGRIADRVSSIIDIADEFAVPVASPRAEGERAGIVVLRPEADLLTTLTASLINHGVSVTTREGAVRISPHASTTDESLEMLRAALMGFATAV